MSDCFSTLRADLLISVTTSSLSGANPYLSQPPYMLGATITSPGWMSLADTICQPPLTRLNTSRTVFVSSSNSALGVPSISASSATSFDLRSHARTLESGSETDSRLVGGTSSSSAAATVHRDESRETPSTPRGRSARQTTCTSGAPECKPCNSAGTSGLYMGIGDVWHSRSTCTGVRMSCSRTGDDKATK